MSSAVVAVGLAVFGKRFTRPSSSPAYHSEFTPGGWISVVGNDSDAVLYTRVRPRLREVAGRSGATQVGLAGREIRPGLPVKVSAGSVTEVATTPDLTDALPPPPRTAAAWNQMSRPRVTVAGTVAVNVATPAALARTRAWSWTAPRRSRHNVPSAGGQSCGPPAVNDRPMYTHSLGSRSRTVHVAGWPGTIGVTVSVGETPGGGAGSEPVGSAEARSTAGPHGWASGAL
jgi:hypothetical protein